MPTAITHGLVGAALAPLAPPGARRGRLALLLAALAALPDLDVLGLYAGIPYGHALGHRGFTHSLLFAALVGPISVSLVCRELPMLGGEWWRAAALASLAAASHGLLDAFTDAGLGIGFLLPFSEERHFFDFRPLETSPLRPSAILSRRMVSVLASEARWVGLPLACALALGALLRTLHRRRRSAAEN